MRIKAILATLIGVVALNGATAGEWCPPAPDKCPVECCPEYSGNVTVGYDTHYIWKGIRFADDFLWGDVSYTFDVGPISPTLGVWHGTDLSSTIGYGDETNIYAGIGLPSMMGVDAALAYTWYLFPTARGPGAPTAGDSISSIGLHLSKDIAGLTASFCSEYYFGADNLSDWYHYAELAKAIDITDCIGVELTAGVAYSDDLYTGLALAGGAGGSGFAHYYLRAGVPISLNCSTTLTPYLGYNATPDGWKGDGTAGFNGTSNFNDIFHGGVSLSVDF